MVRYESHANPKPTHTHRVRDRQIDRRTHSYALPNTCTAKISGHYQIAYEFRFAFTSFKVPNSIFSRNGYFGVHRSSSYDIRLVGLVGLFTCSQCVACTIHTDLTQTQTQTPIRVYECVIPSDCELKNFPCVWAQAHTTFESAATG